MSFDSIAWFEKQFTPTEGGYLYYSAARSGGKLVTAAEFETLASDWQRVAGASGQWKMIGVVFAGVILWAIISFTFSLPEWSTWILAVGMALAIAGRSFWVMYAPRRLVRDRPVVSPPRPIADVKRETRAMLNWRLVGFALFLGGATFFGLLATPQNTISWWAWTIGSGAFFGAYVWIAIQKFRDRKLDT